MYKKLTLKTNTMEVKVEGQVLNNVSGYDMADARVGLHIYSLTDNNDQNSRVVGDIPYKVIFEVNDNINRIIEGILGTIDPFNPFEFNCLIEGLPPGAYDGTISDVNNNDCRIMANWNAIAPPYATLNGEVNPRNILGVMVSFEFGETTDYGYKVSFGEVNGADWVAVSLQLSSGGYNDKSILRPNTTYHYRVIATYPDGVPVLSSDMTFTTPAIAPLVRVLPATNVTN